MQLEEILKEIKSQNWYQKNLVQVKNIPSRSALFGQLKIELSDEVKAFLKRKGITELYLHQIEAIEKIIAGENLIITTQTSSGKTLCFLIPILQAIVEDKTARALLIYPLKALSNDQYMLLKEIKELNFSAGIYDGDTPASKRPYIRENANIILTNPYELHQVLPYHFKWSKFFKNLKYIVIDEAHRYKGIFGSNISNLIHRLKRILNYYCAKPVYVLSSASLGNPLEFASKLTGEKFHHISYDGSPQAEKIILLWNSKSSDPSYLLQVKQILLQLIEHGFKTLCFLKSRRNVELLKSWLKPYNDKIASYRAGYLPQVRREIEKGLREGKIEAVLSTNALELGIDIGELNAVIITGFPGSISSFWQQAGRAGRREKKALIFYLGLEDALEQYLLNHPEILLDPKFENANLEPRNPYIYARHLLCASSELPLQEEEIPPDKKEVIKKLEDKKLISHTTHGYIYTGGGRPQGFVSLENISDDSVELIVEGKVFETMDYQRTLREIYPGAIYLSQGKSYLVKKLDLKNKIAELKAKEVDYYTELIKLEEVKIKEKFKCIKDSLYSLNYGFCEITENYIGYKVKKFDHVLGFKELDLPESEFLASTIWIELALEVRKKIQTQGLDYEGGLHALEHLLIAIAPLIASCDRNDLGGRAYPVYPDTGSPCIFIFESYQGGVGIAERLYLEFDKFLNIALNHIKNCSCESGCPSCVLSPKCGNNNTPMDKSSAISILSQL